MTYPKFFLAIFVAGVAAFAQVPTGAPPTPARPKVPPETVIASSEGKPITAGEVYALAESMGPQLLQFFNRDPKEFVRQYALQTKLAGMARAEKLDQETPYKERLKYAEQSVLMQSLVDRRMNATPINESDIKAVYDRTAAQNTQHLTKVIYVSFAPDGKGGRTEAEAKSKIEGLRKQAIEGGDFLKLVKENSDDAMSRDKNGDYPPIKKSDPLPEAVKSAVLALKPGELTEPIRQANGFYVFRLEKIEGQPLEKVREQIINQIRQERFNAWFQGVRNSTDVKFENEAFFAPATPATPPTPAAAPGTQTEQPVTPPALPSSVTRPKPATVKP